MNVFLRKTPQGGKNDFFEVCYGDEEIAKLENLLDFSIFLYRMLALRCFLVYTIQIN